MDVPRPVPKAILLLTMVASIGLTGSAQHRSPSSVRDLQGLWTNGTVTPLQRTADLAGKEFLSEPEAVEYERTWLDTFRRNFPPEDLQAPDLDYTYMDRMKVVPTRRTSLITDPPDGRLPPQLPAAKERAAARPKASHDDPELLGLDERCLLATAFGSSNAAPPMVPNPFGQNIYQIVQTPDHVLIFTETVHDARIIRIGGNHLPPHVQLWLGDSIGRWEADTLVVDTTNFTVKTHFRGSGPGLHVVERFTRSGAATIRYQFTADDPETWARPWTADVPFTATAERMFEYACHEANYSMANVLRGARAEERRKQE
ncbi:MAG: hypothetical protein JWL71_3272 [Acidobacteria bacterium]|nr:hypothetical protein [Acidobacteriota bacterium]